MIVTRLLTLLFLAFMNAGCDGILGIEGFVAGCNEGQVQCSPEDVRLPQSCDAEGHWIDAEQPCDISPSTHVPTRSFCQAKNSSKSRPWAPAFACRGFLRPELDAFFDRFGFFSAVEDDEQAGIEVRFGQILVELLQSFGDAQRFALRNQSEIPDIKSVVIVNVPDEHFAGNDGLENSFDAVFAQLAHERIEMCCAGQD